MEYSPANGGAGVPCSRAACGQARYYANRVPPNVKLESATPGALGPTRSTTTSCTIHDHLNPGDWTEFQDTNPNFYSDGGLKLSSLTPFT
ncbi:hypothetical protein ColTof4_00824 [Colletotrichum tofieldiae]|nr:hypothetical protein ColTof3_08038 [Colletotrichum tofieldiae]GKT68401.1 hypothetical protein ColTof4_00824 [Colletotrichum tofieldiae]